MSTVQDEGVLNL